MSKLTGKDIVDCAMCGEFASQALDVGEGKYGVDRWYYIHCFDGDCGNEGPRCSTSDESIKAWNSEQADIAKAAP